MGKKESRASKSAVFRRGGHLGLELFLQTLGPGILDADQLVHILYVRSDCDLQRVANELLSLVFAIYNWYKMHPIQRD